MDKKVSFLAGALAVICAMFGIALLNSATPATVHAETVPITICQKWDPLNAVSFDSVRNAIVDPVDSLYGTMSPDYDGTSITWSDAIKFYTNYDPDHPDVNMINDYDMVATYNGDNIYVVVDLPEQSGFDAQSGCYMVYVRKFLTANIRIYGEMANGISLGYTGAPIETEVELFSGLEMIDSLGAEVQDWAFGMDRVEDIKELGNYDNPYIALSGEDADNYFLDPMTYNVCSVIVSTRHLTVKADKEYDGMKEHPIVPIYTYEEEQAISHGHDIDIQFPDIKIEENEIYEDRDYIRVNSGYSITLSIPDAEDREYYSFTGDFEKTFFYDITKADPIISLSLKDGAHWYYDNYVVLADGTVIRVDESDGLDELYDVFDINVTSSQTNNADFRMDDPTIKFHWVNGPEANGHHIGDDPIYNTITLMYDGSNNYNDDSAINYVVDIEKAPVYVRCSADFTYSGNEQCPDEDDFELYIYKADDDDYLAYVLLGEADDTDYIYANNTQSFTNAGIYSIQITLDNGSSLNNAFYELSSDGATYTIQKKTLYVYSNNADVIYGDELPTFEIFYKGFVDGEDESDLGVAPWASTSYERYDNVGDVFYDITISGGYSNNYEFDYEYFNYNKKLEVHARSVTITSRNSSSIYYQDLADFVASEVFTGGGEGPGIVNGDNVYSLVCYEEGETLLNSHSPAGMYTVNVVLNTESDKFANYLFTTYPNGVYRIYEATITDATASQSGTLTYNGEAQQASVATSATTVDGCDYLFQYSKQEKDGEWGALPTFTDAGNYTVWYKVLADNHETTEPASFTVTIAPRPITVTADDKESIYGNDTASLTATVSVNSIIAGDATNTIYTLSCDADKTDDVGEYTITVNVVGNTNYTVTPVNGTYTIKARPATVYCTYDGDGLFVTYRNTEEWTALGNQLEANLCWLACDELVNGDNLLIDGLITMRFVDQDEDDATEIIDNATAPVGMYFMSLTDNSANYDFSFSLANAYFTVQPAMIVITDDEPAQTNELTYNGVAQTATVSATATTVDGCDYEFTYCATSDGEYKTDIPAFTSAGSHMVFFKVVAENHSDVSGMFRVTIAQKEITANFTNTTVTYNGQGQNPTFTGFTGLIGEDDVAVNFLGGNTIGAQTWEKQFALVGTKASNYTLSSNTIPFTIQQLVVEYTASVSGHGDEDLVAVYNGLDHVLTVTLTNRQGSDDVAIRVHTHETENQAGVYTSTLILDGADGNHVFSAGEDTINWTIARREVGIDWDQDTFTYDAQAHTPIVTLTNVITGDEVYVSWSAGTAQTDVVEDAVATIVGLSNDNYCLPLEGLDGTITIEPREVTLTWTEEKDGVISFVYNGSAQTPVATAGNVVGADVVTVSVQGGQRNVGNYTATAYQLSNPNYVLPVANTHAFAITPKAVTVTYTSSHKEVTYGDMDAWEDLGDEMFLNGFYLEADWAQGDATFTSLALAMNTQLDGQGKALDMTGQTFPDAEKYYFILSSNDNNYEFTFDLGDDAYLTVNPREITVTIADKTSVYGDATVELEAEITDGTLFTSDDEEDVYSLVCGATSTSDVGEYAITVRTEDDNYAITFVPAIYTITVRNITVTIANKTSVYGDNTVELTHAVTTSSIVNDDEDVYSVSCVASKTSNVGQYAIAGLQGDNDNYHVEFVNGTYTITARPITVAIANKTSVYGDNRVALTSGVTQGNIVNNDQNVYALQCAINAETIVGQYAITGTRNNTNYNITFVDGVYTITQREVSLAWGESTFVYDDSVHAPVATAQGLVNNDAITVYVTGGQVNAGDYTATASELRGAKAGNYKLPVARTHAFTITKPASYDKPIDPETIAEEGLDLTNVFKNMDTTAEDAELKFEIATSTLVFDKTAIEAIATSDEQVKLTFNTMSGEDAKTIDKGAVFAFEITLEGATFENGEATVSADFENKAPTGKVARVYYVSADGRRTNMNATFENGKVTFKTNHFSNYIVVYELSTLSIILIVLAILILVAVIVLVVLYFILKKKGIDMFKFMKRNKKAVAPKAEEKKAEEKEEKKEDAKEEIKEEPKQEKMKEDVLPEKKPAEKKPVASGKKKTPAKKKSPAKKK